jgi:phenylpropionate dioxygenase-like ring-hydroxylating dioxygenase large terminal subunit
VALSQELPEGGAPRPVRLLGEDLILFRDDAGRPGLLALHYSHRGADLSYGCLEDGGLRCIYHGWLYDIHGNCLEQPGEPAGSGSCEKIRHRAYPCKEVGGIIFAYFGPGDPPLLPNYEAFAAPESHRFARKFLQESNYLQGTEGNIDPVHQSFLHRQLRDDENSRDQPFGTAGTDLSNLTLYREDICPRIEAEPAEFGLRIFAVRDSVASLGQNKRWIKILNFVMPNLCFVPGEMGKDGYNINWHVPIDDTRHWKWMITFSRGRAIDKESFERKYRAQITSDYRPVRGKENRYLQDRKQMRDQWYSGLGAYFPVHDIWATDSQGPIQDRTQEHLGYTDKAIVAARKVLHHAIQAVLEGKEPPHVVRDPRKNFFPEIVVLSEVLPASEDWKSCWRRASASRESSLGGLSGHRL